MKRHLVVAALGVGILGGCSEQPPATTEVLMAPMEVGTRTPDYEVVSPTELKLAAGVKLQELKDADGQNNGFVLLRPNGALGGFMACGCSGETRNACKTENDNPEHPLCSGSCVDGQGNPHPCFLEGLTGPPRNPFRLRFLERPASPVYGALNGLLERSLPRPRP